MTGIMTALSVAGFLTSATTAFAQVAPTVALDIIAPQTVTIGDVLSFVVHATDSDPVGIITYSMLQTGGFNAPVINPTTGVFTWDTGLSRSACGTYNFNVSATGSTGGSDTKSVSVAANAIPGTLCLPYQYTYVGTSTVITTFVGSQVIAGATSNGNAMTMRIPAFTTITGPVGWNGILYLPTATTTTINAVSSVFMGFRDMLLTFSRGVRLDFAGQAGNSISYTHGAGTPTEITNICSADTQDAGDALPNGGDCKIDVGPNLVVWTKHFSTFTTNLKMVQAAVMPKNKIVLNSDATVRVAVFGAPDFDATIIDPKRTVFAGASINHASKNHPLVSYRDVNRDGTMDAVLHFKVDELHLNVNDTSALLDGYTTGGVHFRAIVPIETKTPKNRY